MFFHVIVFKLIDIPVFFYYVDLKIAQNFLIIHTKLPIGPTVGDLPIDPEYICIINISNPAKSWQYSSWPSQSDTVPRMVAQL